MLEKVFVQKFYLQKHLEAPLLKEREEYLGLYYLKGVCHHYLWSIAEYTLRIAEYLHLKDGDTRLITLAEIEAAAEKWARRRFYHPQRRKYSKKGRRRFIVVAKDWLKFCNRLELLQEDSVPIFNELFEKKHTRRKMVAAPLLNERIEYLQYWKEHGAKRATLRIYAEYELHIIKYLSLETLRRISLKEIYEAAKVWAKDKRSNGRFTKYSKCAERRFIIYSKKWLAYMKNLEVKADEYPFYNESQSYLDYLLSVKEYSSRTIKTRNSVFRLFFGKLGLQCNDLAKIKPIHIDRTIATMSKDGKWSRRTISSITSVLRNFLEYAELQGWCMNGLSKSIRSPKVYYGEDLPCTLKREDIKMAVEYYDSDTLVAIRNYAILLLLVVYGIRSSEVTNLKIKDIDWEKEQLYLSRAKGCKPQIFPLVESVGDAILQYLKRSRKNKSPSEYLFLCVNAPYRRMSPSAVWQIVHKCLISLGIELKHYGPHSLRHSCATHLVNSGFSMKEICEHLGHQQFDTTYIYTKVDLNNLRKVAEINWEDVL